MRSYQKRPARLRHTQEEAVPCDGGGTVCEGRRNSHCQLTKDGKIKLTVNGKEAATGRRRAVRVAAGDALCAGFDDPRSGRPYTAPFRYTGKSKS